MSNGEPVPEASNVNPDPRNPPASETASRVVGSSDRKLTAEEAFGDVRGQFTYQSELTEPTSNEWAET
jgi:hypothetical protein